MKDVVTPYGSFTLFPSDCIGTIIASEAFWDECLRPFMDALQPGDVYVDVGANIGFFPVYLGKRGVVCHAFEAAPEVYEVLCENVRRNGLTANLYNVALYDHETDLVLHRDWKNWTAVVNEKMDYQSATNSGWLCLVPEAIGDASVKFHAKTLDSYHIQDVKLLKTDTQGCDLRILHGARTTIETFHPVVLFEYEGFVSEVHGDTFDKYVAFFEELGYGVRQIGDVEYVAERVV